METGRVEAFSDGVFAIAVTLLILAVGIEQSIAGDRPVMLLNILLLMCISLTPFPGVSSPRRNPARGPT